VGSNPVVGQDLGPPAKMASKTPLEVLSAPSELPGENLGEGLNLQHQRCAGDRRYCALPQGAGWWVAAAKESSPRKVWTPSRGSMVAVLSLMTLRLRRRSFFLSFRGGVTVLLRPEPSRSSCMHACLPSLTPTYQSDRYTQLVARRTWLAEVVCAFGAYLHHGSTIPTCSFPAQRRLSALGRHRRCPERRQNSVW
jgi:hypothetical protein